MTLLTHLSVLYYFFWDMEGSINNLFFLPSKPSTKWCSICLVINHRTVRARDCRAREGGTEESAQSMNSKSVSKQSWFSCLSKQIMSLWAIYQSPYSKNIGNIQYFSKWMQYNRPWKQKVEGYSICTTYKANMVSSVIILKCKGFEKLLYSNGKQKTPVKLFEKRHFWTHFFFYPNLRHEDDV